VPSTTYDLNCRPRNNADRFSRGNATIVTSHGQAYTIAPNGHTTNISTTDYEKALAARNAYPVIIGRT
jgi:hypothetical protein